LGQSDSGGKHKENRLAFAKMRRDKITRRILVKIVEGNIEVVSGDTTLADPSIVGDLVKERVWYFELKNG
jgi:hypothetical protein